MKKFLDHNAAFLMACVWASVSLIWFYGCEPKVASLTTVGLKVTRPQLTAEIESLNAQVKARETDLDRQDLLRQRVSKQLSLLSQGGTLSSTGVLNLALGILGLGAVATYRKKDSVIKTLKNNVKNANQTGTSSTRVTPTDN